MILVLSTQNNRLAGFILTGNSSMFFDTKGSISWIYQCPLKVIDQSYSRISIHYNDRTLLVDPITRQYYLAANEVKCVGSYKIAS